MFVPYGAGTPKFTVNIGIATLKTFLAQIDAVLGAHIAGFSIWMIYAFPHFFSFQVLSVFLTLGKLLTLPI